MTFEHTESRNRKLAYLLRHDCKYSYESGGWRLISDLIDNHSFTNEEIGAIVFADCKGRFELNRDKTKVRALYGHSVEVDLLFRKQEPPALLLHGTALKYIDSIRNYGLKSKSRQYVHLTEDKDLAIKTGSRHGKAVLLVIDSQAMSNDGYVFYGVSDGTWLTKNVPPEYIQFKYLNNS